MVGMIIREYSAAFGARMVERMVGPQPMRASALLREVGGSQGRPLAAVGEVVRLSLTG